MSAPQEEMLALIRKMGHRLRKPLIHIANLIDQLEHGTESMDAATRDSLEQIRHNALSVLETLDKVIEIFRIESVNPALQPISLPDLFQRACTEAQILARDLGCNIVNEVPGDLPMVTGNESVYLVARTALNAVVTTAKHDTVFVTAIVENGSVGVSIRAGTSRAMREMSPSEFLDQIGDVPSVQLFLCKHLLGIQARPFWLEYDKDSASFSWNFSLPTSVPADGNVQRESSLADAGRKGDGR